MLAQGELTTVNLRGTDHEQHRAADPGSVIAGHAAWIVADGETNAGGLRAQRRASCGPSPWASP
ncbi:hypothetical protein HBB16_05730 [Pseudonocardia sp. MCCB 268]|nr:hypothetical protein [Pseudonocardia cytotoxica]